MKYIKRLFKYELAADFAIQIQIRPEQTIEHEFFHLSATGLLLIRRGYRWDGPSGPTYDSTGLMIGSLIHDVGYQMTREGHFDIREDRAAWDKVYRETIIAHGINPIRAWGHWYALSKFGWSSALPHEEHIYEA